MNFINELKMRKDYILDKFDGECDNYNDYVDKRIQYEVSLKNMPEEYYDKDKSNVFRIMLLRDFQGKWMMDSSSFYLERPSGMEQEDVLKVISFCRRNVLELYGENVDIIQLVQDTLIKDYGFKAIIREEVDVRNVVDLHFIDKYDLAFMDSPFWKSEFGWYNRYPFVNQSHIDEIYRNLGINIKKKIK